MEWARCASASLMKHEEMQMVPFLQSAGGILSDSSCDDIRSRSLVSKQVTYSLAYAAKAASSSWTGRLLLSQLGERLLRGDG